MDHTNNNGYKPDLESYLDYKRKAGRKPSNSLKVVIQQVSFLVGTFRFHSHKQFQCRQGEFNISIQPSNLYAQSLPAGEKKDPINNQSLSLKLMAILVTSYSIEDEVPSRF